MIKIDSLKITNGQRWGEYRLNIKGQIDEEYVIVVETDDGFNIERAPWDCENGNRVSKRVARNNYAVYTTIDLGWLEGEVMKPCEEFSTEDCLAFWKER